MKSTCFTLCMFLAAMNAIASGETETKATSLPSPVMSSARVTTVNASDSVVIDLDNFIKVGNDIAVPVYILTDDTVFSLDFSFKYDHANIEYDTIINQTSYIQPLAFYNAVDSTVRFTSYAGQAYATGTTLLYVHFNLLAFQLTSLDIFSLNAYLNGDPCSMVLLGGIPSGVQDLAVRNARVYPNPVNEGILHVECPVAAELLLMNSDGQALVRKTSMAGEDVQLPTSGLPAGTYLLRMTGSGREETRKIVVH